MSALDSGPSGICPLLFSTSIEPEIDASGFRISCAIFAAIPPTAATSPRM